MRWRLFFQAEDGIRYLTVTGVQTCALPISPQEVFRPLLAALVVIRQHDTVRPVSDPVHETESNIVEHVFVNMILEQDETPRDRKSTRLNSSHSQISYAVFCLKKKKK